MFSERSVAYECTCSNFVGLQLLFWSYWFVFFNIISSFMKRTHVHVAIIICSQVVS